MSEFVNNAIFWIEVEKIKPNPYQPRKEFDQVHLQGLADSIRQYGVLQPLVVTRSEKERPEGGLDVEYELIAGERRLRASKLAGIARVPAIIQQQIDPRLKLELAIIENLQREDLNPVDRALSFSRLAQEFSLKHLEIAKKVGKSREYVSNSLRLLVLPQDVLDALSQGRITEGHARPLMMLTDKKEEQGTLFKEIVAKQLTVREAEQIARHIAQDRLRKHRLPPDPEIERLEKEFAESLGTRVSIERRQVGGGKLVIDFFSSDDLRALLFKVHLKEQGVSPVSSPDEKEASVGVTSQALIETSTPVLFAPVIEELLEASEEVVHSIDQHQLLQMPHDREVSTLEEIAMVSTPVVSQAPVSEPEEDDALYSVKNFSF
jgi:ParB family chromosome partitioning protein